jgi:SRSO17 transposase
MAVASIEATLELWASALREVKARMRPLFTQERVAVSAGLFLDSLLGNEPRKTGWMRAQAAVSLQLTGLSRGDPGPWRQQTMLGRGRWQADALRAIVRDCVVEHRADEDAVVVVDETGFLKQAKAPCGVARQYTGSAGHITNCQVGVFAASVSRHGHAFIDRALYLPKPWAEDPARMAAAHVPQGVGFATKPALALRMIARALDAGVPFRWGAADRVYGSGAVEMAVRRAGVGYVLGVTAKHQFCSGIGKPPVAGTAEAIAHRLDPAAWQRLSAGAGAKGPRLDDWASCELADLEAAEYHPDRSGLWTRGLLIRRTIADGELAFFSTWCPAGTTRETLVRIEGHRWAIEDGFETAKTAFGLDHNETRSWHGWHRHVSLVMLAFAMMAAIRHQANHTAPPKTLLRTVTRGRLPRAPTHPSSAGRSRTSAALPCASPSAVSGPPISSPGHSGDAPIRPLHSKLI